MAAAARGGVVRTLAVAQGEAVVHIDLAAAAAYHIAAAWAALVLAYHIPAAARAAADRSLAVAFLRSPELAVVVREVAVPSFPLLAAAAAVPLYPSCPCHHNHRNFLVDCSTKPAPRVQRVQERRNSLQIFLVRTVFLSSSCQQVTGLRW